MGRKCKTPPTRPLPQVLDELHEEERRLHARPDRIGGVHWSDLVDVCRRLNVVLAIDNSGGDSSGVGASVNVVTETTSVVDSFAGTTLGLRDDLWHASDERLFLDVRSLAQELRCLGVVAVYSTSEGTFLPLRVWEQYQTS